MIKTLSRGAAKKPLSQKTKRTLWGYLFVSPALIYFLIWVFLPVAASFALSFTNYNTATADWVGLKNYIDIFTQSKVHTALVKTIQFGLELIPANLILSLYLAVLVDQKIRGVSFFRTIYYLPVLTSLVIAGIVWASLFDPRTGAMNWLLRLLKLPPQQWLYNPDLALHSVVVVRIWKGVGYNMMVFLAGLQSISQELYEVAALDGASDWARFRYITLPLLKPTAFYIFVMACISSFQVFGEIYVMTRGGPAGATRTLIYLIYEEAFQYTKMGYASALAFVLFLFVAGIALFNLLFVNRFVEENT